MLKVDNLNYNYPKTNEKILENISFSVDEGSLCGLFGPNGCGKSTLFKCCLNLLRLEQGAIHINGKSIKNLKIKEMAKIAAYVPQEHKPPFPYLVREVVLMGRTPHLKGFFGINSQDKKKVKQALELLEISHLSEKNYNTLSGGQRQMVLMARAIAQETRIMFLDEPTSALDFSNQIKIWKIMRKISDSGITIFACSHDPNHVSWFCDKVVVVNDKRIFSSGCPKDVITQQTLDSIYKDTCDVKQMDETKVVFPSNLNRLKAIL
jgi:iron complex transport system ATP-binding protein